MSETARREQILAAARQVFDEKGYESATVSDIVGRAGCAQGTFYLYFPSKKDVIVGLARKPMELVSRRLQTALNADSTFEETLRAMVANGFAIAREYPDLCLMIHMSGDGEADVSATEAGRDISAMKKKLFKGAAASGQMQDIEPEIAGDLFHSILSGAMKSACADGSAERFDEVEAAVADVIVRAFVKG